MATSVADNRGRVLKRANPETIQDKFLVGYQGWFTCGGDGEPIDPGHHGWLHWFNHPIPSGGRPNVDVWPDVSSYDPSELYPAPGLKLKSGEPVRLFSSRNAKTVQRHFHWMAEYGVDGAFLQRFAGQCDVETSGEGIRRLRDEVGDRVREAAEKEGRVFAIMYDISGVPADRLFRVLQRDWTHLIRNKRVLDSPNYLKEKGKPVIGIWGFGFSPTQHTPALLRAIAHFFRTNTPGSAYLFAGVPAHWRTCDGDAAPANPAEVITPEIWMETFDAISPWTIGRYRNELEVERWGEGRMKDDWGAVKGWNEEHVNAGVGTKVDYVPVVFPGGSGYNLSEGKWGFNDIPRRGGRFLWQQIFNAKRLGGGGMRTVYGAMWDEYDEGTAFMPIVEHKYQLPQHDNYTFMALDEDGYDVPSDWYMKICGFAAEALRGERRVFESFPSKELQDYWGTRPKYEDGHFSPGAIVGGGGGASSGGSSSGAGTGYGLVAGGSSGGGDGGSGSSAKKLEDGEQSYEQWLAMQKDDKEEAPPPPYSLEAEEQEAAAAAAASAPVQPPVQARLQQPPAQAPGTTPSSTAPSSIHPLPLGVNPNLPSTAPGGGTYPGQYSSYPGSPGHTPGSVPGTPNPISPVGPASPPAPFAAGIGPGTASPNPNVPSQNQPGYPPYGQTPQSYGQQPQQPYGPQQQLGPGQPQDPVAALANDFRRYNSIGGPYPGGGSAAPGVGGVGPERRGSGGRISAASPPPLHPAHPAAANGPGAQNALPGGYPASGRPSRPTTAGGGSRPPSQTRPQSGMGMGRPQSQQGLSGGYAGYGGQQQYTGHHQSQVHQGYQAPSQQQATHQATAASAAAAQWPPQEWNIGGSAGPVAGSTPPPPAAAAAANSHAHGHGYGHAPASNSNSGYGVGGGANLSRPNTFAASSAAGPPPAGAHAAYGHAPAPNSGYGGGSGANLSRPNTFSASSAAGPHAGYGHTPASNSGYGGGSGANLSRPNSFTASSAAGHPASSPPPAAGAHAHAHGHGYGHTSASNSDYGGASGANLSRPNTFVASSTYATGGGAQLRPHPSLSASTAPTTPPTSTPISSAGPTRPGTASGYASSYAPSVPTSTPTPPPPSPYPGVGPSFGNNPPALYGHTPSFHSHPGTSSTYAPSTTPHSPSVSTYPGQQAVPPPWLGGGPQYMSPPHSPPAHGGSTFPDATASSQSTYPDSLAGAGTYSGSSSAYPDPYYPPSQGSGAQFPGSVGSGGDYGPSQSVYGGSTSPSGYAMQFPYGPSSTEEGNGAAGYYGDGSGPGGGGGGMPLPSPTVGSSGYPGQYGSTSSTSSSYQPYPETTTMPAPGGYWTPPGPTPPSIPPRPATSYNSSSSKPPSFPVASTMGASALDFAWSTVDKVAGRKTRDQLENQVGSLAQSSSKLFNKFTK